MGGPSSFYASRKSVFGGPKSSVRGSSFLAITIGDKPNIGLPHTSHDKVALHEIANSDDATAAVAPLLAALASSPKWGYGWSQQLASEQQLTTT